MAYVGFKQLTNRIAAEGDVRDPAAIAAAIGRKKYGAKAMAQGAASGKSLRRQAILGQMKGQ